MTQLFRFRVSTHSLLSLFAGGFGEAGYPIWIDTIAWVDLEIVQPRLKMNASWLSSTNFGLEFART